MVTMYVSEAAPIELGFPTLYLFAVYFCELSVFLFILKHFVYIYTISNLKNT